MKYCRYEKEADTGNCKGCEKGCLNKEDMQNGVKSGKNLNDIQTPCHKKRGSPNSFRTDKAALHNEELPGRIK